MLEDCGIETVLERGGRYFPKSEKASDVADALYKKAKSLGVEFLFNTTVTSINYNDNKVKSVSFIRNNKEDAIETEKVIICAG